MKSKELKIDCIFCEKKYDLGLFIICFLVFLLGFFAAYKRITISGNGDYMLHINWAEQLINGQPLTAYEDGSEIKSVTLGWHYIAGFFILMGFPKSYAAGIANGLFLCAACFVLYKLPIWEFLKIKLGRTAVSIIVLSLFIVGPLFIPFLDSDYYFGSNTFNVWHNPTFIGIKPFIVFISFYFLYVYSMDKNEKIDIFDSFSVNKKVFLYLVLGIALVISNYIKPSFAQVFLPSICIFMFFEWIFYKKKFKECVLNSLFIVPSILITLIQFLVLFVGGATVGDNHVAFGLFKTFKTWSTSTPLMAFMLINFFPILCIIGTVAGKWKKIIEDKYIFFALIQLVVGYLQWIVLYETGSRITHGNFVWGYDGAILVFWIIAVIRFFEYFVNNIENVRFINKAYISCCFILLFSHLAFGIWYYKDYILIGDY